MGEVRDLASIFDLSRNGRDEDWPLSSQNLLHLGPHLCENGATISPPGKPSGQFAKSSITQPCTARLC